ncbi:proline-rich protein HaeIII subfamily 1-like [Gouania willdenowi]|uniref:proline-rich protein HaeIII subfamily 1-like n=1 Tax=Gouania willdenowi TaxID=441366 RepID=UPI001055D32B|nr:proline-rich protein HaeIII subfamily 1-like [Gouania willdenowi]
MTTHHPPRKTPARTGPTSRPGLPDPKGTIAGQGTPKGEPQGQTPMRGAQPTPAHKPATTQQERTAPDGARTAAQAPPPTGQRKPWGGMSPARPHSGPLERVDGADGPTQRHPKHPSNPPKPSRLRPPHKLIEVQDYS